jgi:hypothetical protein
MRKILILAALALFLFPGPARAQENISLVTAAISLWPEYDRPSALVITEMTLAPDTPLPAQVVLRVPSTVDKVQAVAVGNALNTVTDQGVVYTFNQGDEWSDITIDATGRAIRVEYYDTALAKNDSARDYTYLWPGDYPVGDFSFVLRAPLKSSNVTSQPPLNRDIIDQDGFEYWTAQPGSLKQGEPFKIDLSYQRSTDLPSTAFLVTENTAGTVAPTSSWTNFVYGKLPYIIGLLGLALLIGGGWWFWRSGREGAKGSPRKRHVQRAPADDDDEEVYCHNCGRRASPTDRFCRACGTRLRQADS